MAAATPPVAPLSSGNNQVDGEWDSIDEAPPAGTFDGACEKEQEKTRRSEQSSVVAVAGSLYLCFCFFFSDLCTAPAFLTRR